VWPVLGALRCSEFIEAPELSLSAPLDVINFTIVNIVIVIIIIYYQGHSQKFVLGRYTFYVV